MPFGIIKQLLPSYEIHVNTRLSTLERLFSLRLKSFGGGKQPPSGWQLSMFTSYECKVIGQFRCFFGKFVDNGDNPVNKPSIYNVEGNIRLSPGRQSMTTGSV